MAVLSLRRALAAALLLAGCYSPGEGVNPPLRRIYFPVGLAVSPGNSRLYVVNSDYDLQYNAGVLQAYDLERIRALLPVVCDADSDCPADQRCDSSPSAQNGGTPSRWCVASSGARAGQPCGALGEKSAADLVTQPGRCGPLDPNRPPDGGESLIVGTVGIGAFATDVIFVSRPPIDGVERPGGRLFLPVRGDSSLHWIDVDDDSKSAREDFVFRCGQEHNDGRCDDAHRAGKDSADNTRGLRLPPEPYGIAASAGGQAITLTHQTEGVVSLFVQQGLADWGDGVSTFGRGPHLEFLTGNMPSRPIGIAAVPRPAVVAADPSLVHHPGFLVTYRDAAQIQLLRYYDDLFTGTEPNNPARPFLDRASSMNVTSNSVGFDSRGIAVDAVAREECEARCARLGGELSCLTDCAGIPVSVYVANRAPSSLLVGQTRPNAGVVGTDDLPHFDEVEPMPFGPSRVIVGDVIGPDGRRQRRVFVVCFDSHTLMIYDPAKRRLEAVVTTGRGPQAFALDVPAIAASADRETDRPAYAYGFIGHFTDSWLGVIDLDQRHATYGKLIMTLGAPSAPRSSK
ncbi:MAG: hypothetical protein OZ921_13375 [Sorangiineae bacterium]|nr:hypothetical protein [Polyangiaceae bacterium]MEB2323496.1 hypothetical protein [Sorangiineae bacterium]